MLSLYIVYYEFKQKKNTLKFMIKGKGSSDDIHAHWQLTEDAQPMLFYCWYTICVAQPALN